jgi:hypothetical protein
VDVSVLNVDCLNGLARLKTVAQAKSCLHR